MPGSRFLYYIKYFTISKHNNIILYTYILGGGGGGGGGGNCMFLHIFVDHIFSRTFFFNRRMTNIYRYVTLTF